MIKYIKKCFAFFKNVVKRKLFITAAAKQIKYKRYQIE